MKDEKLEILQIVLKPYTLGILRTLTDKPMRYGDLKKQVKNDRTLSLKLSALQDHGLIKMVHVKDNGKYVNLYEITNKGKSILEGLKRI
jgi:DNA-binding HxlR family transcriptional regulator